MVDDFRRLGGRGRTARPPMPTTVLLTTVTFLFLALLFALGVLLRLTAEDGTVAAALFFATLGLACVAVAAGLVGRRRWAAPVAYALSGLLAAASAGLFGAITVVGVGLLVWVSWALTRAPSRRWLRR